MQCNLQLFEGGLVIPVCFHQTQELLIKLPLKASPSSVKSLFISVVMAISKVSPGDLEQSTRKP